jgi:hypothetical protein
MVEETDVVIVAMIAEQDVDIKVATSFPVEVDEDVLLQDVDVQEELSQQHTMLRNNKNQKNNNLDLTKYMRSRVSNLPIVLELVLDVLLRINSSTMKNKRNTIGIRKTSSRWILRKNKRIMVNTDC